jgi:hypothetical protein
MAGDGPQPMDLDLLQRRLERAEKNLSLGERHLDLQRKVIAALEKTGQGYSSAAVRARDLLASIEESQRRDAETRNQLQEKIRQM